ncbi:perlucin-like protein [Mya arenaria]|uniref:perlucin-like protein n=1 Tax=Mya arenaria TaxID=6604 RepID=UPI0022E3FF16|nr:perlucin-like protein [Mya arenaria]
MYWWIGLSDRTIEGEWRWLSSDDIPSYTYWDTADHQPENHNALDQDCASLHIPSGYKWHDDVCSGQHAVICEKLSESEVIPIG